MTFIVAASAHGSPGVSTALQMVASLWPASPWVPVLVEADASGGVQAARFGLSITPGFVTLVESLRKAESPPLLDHAQRLPSGVACVPLSPSATAASAQLRSAGPYLGSYLSQVEHPVLFDAGTMLPDSKIVQSVIAADLLLWFVRPTREELLVLRHRLAECPQVDNVAVVLVGDRPYDAAQVEDALEVRVIHTVPVDRRGADAMNLGGADRYLRRSPLARSCTQLAQTIHATTARVELPLPPPPARPAAIEPEVFDDEPGEDVPPPPLPPPPPESSEPELVVWTSDSHD